MGIVPYVDLCSVRLSSGPFSGQLVASSHWSHARGLASEFGVATVIARSESATSVAGSGSSVRSRERSPVTGGLPLRCYARLSGNIPRPGERGNDGKA